jgi:hypothetical protein
VRHGHLPEREIVTGVGPVAVRCPRVRDRAGEGSERIRFSSAILPPYARRSKRLFKTLAVLWTQQRCPWVFGHTSSIVPSPASFRSVVGKCVPLDPVDQACFLNSSTSTRVFSL